LNRISKAWGEGNKSVPQFGMQMVDEAETVGFGRKKDYLIWTK